MSESEHSISIKEEPIEEAKSSKKSEYQNS